MVLTSIFMGVIACLPDARGVDLEGPRITQSSLEGPRSVEIPVAPEFVLELSEALDPASVHPGSVALVAWDRLDQRCEFSPVCERGRCERGQCQISTLSASERAALERGVFDPTRPGVIALDHVLVEGDAGPGTRLILRPRRPLAGHRRHTLLLGPGLHDEAGAPLVDEFGRAVSWQRDFVTAGGGSAGPEPRLASPAPGQGGVATNLASIETELWPPVPEPDPRATLLLEARGSDGLEGVELVELVEPRACPGFVPGTCLRWRVADQLEPNTRYRPAGGSLVDRLGRQALRPGPTRETWFATGAGPDRTAPEARVEAHMRSRCLALWVELSEPVEAVLQVGSLEHAQRLHGSSWIGVELEDFEHGGAGLDWTLELRDLAANTSEHRGSVRGDQALETPWLRVSEVLANPKGAEPDAEFIELQAGPAGISLEGLWLSDLDAAALHEAWRAGQTPAADALPAVVLEPDEVVIVVGQDWLAAPELDPAPPASTRILRVDASLGTGGLKNAGESVSVWTPSEAGPIVVASYGNWIETDASSFNGRSVVAGPDACDLPDRWRPHPQGRSSPGRVP